MAEIPKAGHKSSGSRFRVACYTLVVAALFGIDKLLGVVREMVVSRAFGLSPDLDAYFAAFEVPEGLNVIVTGAALTTSLIPLLAGMIARDDGEGRDLWTLISTVVNWVLIIVGVSSVVAAIFARPIILTVAPGFAGQQAQADLATQLMRLVLIQTLIFSASTVVTGTLQAHQHFFLPALSPLFYTVGRIFGAVVLAPSFGIFGLAYGGLIGAVGHLLIKVPWLIYRRARWVPVLTHPELSRLLKLMGPRMLGMGVTYVGFVLPTYIGSHLAGGSITAYEFGWKLMQLPETVLGTAMGIVVFPTLAGMAATGDREGLRKTFSWALRLILAFSIPAAVGMLLLGRPLIMLIFQGGAFDAAATERVYRALQFFSIGLVTHSALEVVARLFYAQRDMWTPLVAAVAGLAVNATVGWLLSSTMAHAALALSNSLGAGLQVVILMLVARRRLDGVEGRMLRVTLLRAGVASAVMGGAIAGFIALLSGAGQEAVSYLEGLVVSMGLDALESHVGLALRGLGGLLIGSVVYGLLALLLGIEEVRSLPRRLLQRKQSI